MIEFWRLFEATEMDQKYTSVESTFENVEDYCRALAEFYNFDRIYWDRCVKMRVKCARLVFIYDL